MWLTHIRTCKIKTKQESKGKGYHSSFRFTLFGEIAIVMLQFVICVEIKNKPILPPNGVMFLFLLRNVSNKKLRLLVLWGLFDLKLIWK